MEPVRMSRTSQKWPADVAPTLRAPNGTPFLGDQDLFSEGGVPRADEIAVNFDMWDVQYGLSPCLTRKHACDIILWRRQ